VLDVGAAIIASSGDAIVTIDPHGLIATWNPAAERLFGFTVAEAIGQPADLSVPEDRVEEFRRFRERVQGGTAPERLETRWRRRDCGQVDVEIVATRLSDTTGPVGGLVCVIRDIHERKAAESDLQEMERRFRAFFEHLPGITYIEVTRAGFPNLASLHRNHAFEELTGYPATEWTSDRSFLERIVHPDDRAHVMALESHSNQTGEPFRAEYRIISRDGREVWVREWANSVLGDDGAPLYWLGFMVDITEEKATEASVAELVAQLKATNHQLEQLSATKSDFVSTISHEFRTPLTSIQGYSELLESEDLTLEEARMFARMVNQNAVRLSRLIGDVLDLDALEAGHQEIRRRPLSLNTIVRQTLDAMQAIAVNHRLVVQIDSDLSDIYGDGDLLERVVANLLVNAVKYSPPGTEIRVTTAPRHDGVELIVSDEGIGVPADHREKIFSRYGRIARPEQSGIEGTGLGLPIARHILEIHNGRIWVEDNSPTGSIFHVVLPIAPDSPPPGRSRR
jgi:PAS domain S-box-containing protein